MSLFKKSPKMTKFVIVTFPHLRYAIDYPKNLPIPRKGESLAIEDPHKTMSHSGIVKQINHSVMGCVHEIRIECKEER